MKSAANFQVHFWRGTVPARHRISYAGEVPEDGLVRDLEFESRHKRVKDNLCSATTIVIEYLAWTGAYEQYLLISSWENLKPLRQGAVSREKHNGRWKAYMHACPPPMNVILAKMHSCQRVDPGYL